MTAGPTVPKVKIKTDEQVRKKKRKRPETDKSRNKKRKLSELREELSDVRSKDKECEKSWSQINIEDEKALMSMGLASLEVLDETDFVVQRAGKRKKTSAPKTCSKKDKVSAKKALKPVDPETCGNSSGPTSQQSVCNRSQPKKLSFSEKKEKVKMKRKEKMKQVKLKRLENPDSEENKLRLEKLKAKRKAKKLKRLQEKQLKSEVDKFIAEKETGPSEGPDDKPVSSENKSVALPDNQTSTDHTADISESSAASRDDLAESAAESTVVSMDDITDFSAENTESTIVSTDDKSESAAENTESTVVSMDDKTEVSAENTESAVVSTDNKSESAAENTESAVVSTDNKSESAAENTESTVVSRDDKTEVSAALLDNEIQTSSIEMAPAEVQEAIEEDSAEADELTVPEEIELTRDSGSVSLTQEEKERGRAWLNLDVCEPIVKGLLELGFLNPTPIQQACIPAGLLKYKDVIGAAETGSGKTLAFGIPLVQRVMRLGAGGGVRGLVLCPTRELALQVTDHLQAASKHTGVRIVPIVGGIAAPKQERLLSYSPPILVATPGRLWQLVQEHPYLSDLSSLKFLVVDEADRMVEDGHFEEVTQIIGRLPGPEQRNTFLFSATLAFTIDRLDKKASKKKKSKKERRAEKKGNAGIEMLVRNIGVKEKVEKVDLTRKKGTATLLTETYFLCNVEDKDLYLYYMLLNHPGKTLVFANSIDGVMNLVHIMKLLELPVFPLHSSLQQRQRFKYLEKFTQSSSAVLICTDIAARGLDIPAVDTVLHYQLPPTKEAYIHRSGRTARADNPGLSVAIVGPKDFKSYKKIASQMSEFPTDGGRIRVLRPAVDLARQIFKIERLRTRPEKKEAKLVALAKEAGFGDADAERDTGGVAKSKREVKIMKAQLKVLLQQPVIDPLNSSRYATTKGALDGFQTINSFSLGVSALEHSKTYKKKSSS